jgi:exodeoxyribonuclease VII large subunit
MSDFSLETPETVYTPTELNREVRIHLEAGFSRVSLEGEISNLAKPASGHLYFSLKDEGAQVRCAMFRTSAVRMSIKPANGMLVLARGRISLYEPRGEYQFIVDNLQDAGIGLLQQRFEQLKQKLEAEGLFAAERKRALPGFPLRIGVITSPSGAVIRDIRHVLARRWPIAEIRLYPTPVQGAEAPLALRSALLQANQEAWAEVLIIARGGGSLEDLQAFNDEGLCRTVAASKLPVISAVGHETDFTICDFVADVRAPTPSAAAEIATPDQDSLRSTLQRSQRMLQARVQFRMQQQGQRLDHLAHRLAQQHPELRLRSQRKDLLAARGQLQRTVQQALRECQMRLADQVRRLQLRHPRRQVAEQQSLLQAAREQLWRSTGQRLLQQRVNLRQLARTLHAVSPLATLDRGYAVLSDSESGRVLSQAHQLAVGQTIHAQLADGRAECTVDKVSDQRWSATANSDFVPES